MTLHIRADLLSKQASNTVGERLRFIGSQTRGDSNAEDLVWRQAPSLSEIVAADDMPDGPVSLVIPEDHGAVPWELSTVNQQAVALDRPCLRSSKVRPTTTARKQAFTPKGLVNLSICVPEKAPQDLPGLKNEVTHLKTLAQHYDIHVQNRESNLLPPHVLHCCGHMRPDSNGITLWQENGNEDRWLPITELIDNNHPPSLAVLMGCRSLIDQRTADSLIAMGCNCVVGSLIDLPDIVASAHLTPFYQDLANGWTVGGALWRWRRHLADLNIPAWMGLVAYGDGSIRLSPKGISHE